MVIRDAWQAIRSSPMSGVFSATVLAGAMAAGAITFSIVDAVALRGLPFENSGRIMLIGPDRPYFTTYSLEEFTAWQKRATKFSALGASAVGPLTYFQTDSGMADERAWEVSASIFDVLRVRPTIGRVFTAANQVEGQNLVAVISYEAWHKYFGGDQNVIGRLIRLAPHRNGEQSQRVFEIIGVMPQGFTYPINIGPQVWVPHVYGSAGTSGRYLEVIGRLRDGVRQRDAQSEIEAIHASVAAATGEVRRLDKRPVVVSLDDAVVGDVGSWMLLLLWGVGLVVLVGCTNVGNLTLARSTTRARDIAIRASLGAAPGRLLLALLTEGLIVAIVAVVLGVAVAWWGLEAAKRALPPDLPRMSDIALNLRVMRAALVVALVAGVVVSAIPMWHAALIRPTDLMSRFNRASPAGGHRQRATVIIGEVALVSTLLVLSALFIVSFVRVTRADLGFSRANVLSFDLPGLPGTMTPLLEAVRAMPGVVSLAEVATSPPLIIAAYGGATTSVRLRPADGEQGNLTIGPTLYRVSPAYFATLGIDLVRGRLFTEADVSSPVAIVDELGAGALFPGERDPIGAGISFAKSQPPLTVIGVVRTVRAHGAEHPSGTQLYLPKSLGVGAASQFLVKTSGPVSAVADDLRAVFARFLPAGVPPPTIRSLDAAFQQLTARRRAIAAVMFIFGVIVLLIGASGIYAVIAAVVYQQRRQLGIRKALGATATRVGREVLVGAAVYVALGLAAGLVGGRIASGFFGSLLFGVRPGDLSIYVIVTVVVLVVGLAAAGVPAFRAARTDPIIELRSE